MANYPTSLDTITNPTSGNTLDNPSHSLQHSDANDILEALETKLGIGASPAGSATSGHALVASTGGTTSWTTIGTAGISSGAATNGQVLTANGSSGVSFTTLPTSGLVLLNTTSFSAVASQSVNDVFSSTYDNYRIVLQLSSFTGGAVNMRMRVSGTDTSSTDYTWVYGAANSDTGTWSIVKNLSTATFFDTVIGANVASTVGSTIEVFAPNLSQRTAITWKGQYVESSSPNRISITDGSGLLRLTTQYTGFTLIAASSTMTGSVSVYGYNK